MEKAEKELKKLNEKDEKLDKKLDDLKALSNEDLDQIAGGKQRP